MHNHSPNFSLSHHHYQRPKRHHNPKLRHQLKLRFSHRPNPRPSHCHNPNLRHNHSPIFRLSRHHNSRLKLHCSLKPNHLHRADLRPNHLHSQSLKLSLPHNLNHHILKLFLSRRSMYSLSPQLSHQTCLLHLRRWPRHPPRPTQKLTPRPRLWPEMDLRRPSTVYKSTSGKQ